jgi:hypothetical protein
MIVTTLTSVDGMSFTARSPQPLTADEIREWERDITWDTERLVAIDDSSGQRYEYVDGEWVSVPSSSHTPA